MTRAQLVGRGTSYDISGDLVRLNFLILQLLCLGSAFMGPRMAYRVGDKSEQGEVRRGG